MNIAFDAKRAYRNTTGLGNYSRTLIASLAKYFPRHHYYLMTPEITERFQAEEGGNITPVEPQFFPARWLKSAWRSNWVKSDLEQLKIDLYHGLSHEIPIGIAKTGIKTVVTIHDLIFERYPEQYSKIDARIYRNKFRYACQNADKVIAISEQTRQDIIEFYKIPESRIEVCYQSCNPSFGAPVPEAVLQKVKERYNLPDRFFLSVGSIIERKNLLVTCKAIRLLQGKLSVPLVVIGEGGAYREKVMDYVRRNGLEHNIIFLSYRSDTKDFLSSSEDFPAIYHLATGMIYNSLFEGFGIPILEALWSRLPVIASNVSCMPETGGDAALYVSPMDEQALADAMYRLATDEELRASMKEKGWQHAQHFTPEKCAEKVMRIYESLVN